MIYQASGLNSQCLVDHHVEDIDSGFKYEMSEREGKTFLLYKNLKNQVILQFPCADFLVF